MRFAFPARLPDIDQFKVDLMHEFGGLQPVLLSLAPGERGGHATKFPVNVRGERVERGFVTVGPVKKKLSCFRDFRVHKRVKSSYLKKIFDSLTVLRQIFRDV